MMWVVDTTDKRMHIEPPIGWVFRQRVWWDKGKIEYGPWEVVRYNGPDGRQYNSMGVKDV